MLGEEYQMIAGSSQNLATPAAPTVTSGRAGSNETALHRLPAPLSVDHRAELLRGDGRLAYAPATACVRGPGRGRHLDRPVAGAQQYNIYVTTPPGPPGTCRSGTTVQSGVSYTGAQTANCGGRDQVHPAGRAGDQRQPDAVPSADTGTGGGNRMEGLIPTLSGLSSTGTGPYVNVGFESSNVWKGGYFNQSVGTHL